MSDDLMQRTVVALENLNRLYRIDRYLSMGAAFASFLLLFYIAYRAFSQINPPWQLMVSFFGASGFLTAAMLRIAYFYREGYKLVAEVVRSEISRDASK